MNKIFDTVKNFLEKYHLQDKTVIVGFSGGFDSMCLLDVLSKLKNIPEFYGIKIIAAHFNHNWRGEEALKEQEICKIFAYSKNIEFYTKTAPANLKQNENEARIARYEFFEDALDENDADALLTAHNFDDNAETVLYRLIKGTGIVGLKGISEKRDKFYRPLLKIKRSEIVDYCNTNNLTPNYDSSNSNIAYRRNFLRLNVIPMMEKINDNVKDALNILAANANNDNAIIEEYLQTIRPLVFKNGGIISSEYKKLSKPLKMRIIYEFIQSLGLDYDYKKIQEVYTFIEDNFEQRNGSTMSLASALWLYADEKIIETIPPQYQISTKNMTEIMVNKEGEYNIGNHTLVIKLYDDKKSFVFPESTSSFAYVNLSQVKFPLTLRTRRDGDIITPFGMTGSMKLKKYLNSKGIPRHKRDNIYMLCKDNEVMWALGIGLNNKIGVINKPTHVFEWR